MSDIAIIGVIIAAAVVLFVTNRLPVVIVAMSVAVALYATGVLSLNAALAGFGDPAVIFIASLFVVSTALERTGVTAWAGQQLIAKAGADSRARLLLLTMLLVAMLTALISVNGAVAALLPVVVVMAVRLKRAPSQLLMPLVFAAHAGSMLALTGTPVNVLVSNAGYEAGIGRFGFFEFTLVGVPLLIGSIAIVILFGERLLPTRSGPSMPSDFSLHARTLVEQYGLSDGLFRLRIRASSAYAGAAPDSVDLSGYPGLTLMAIQQGETGAPLKRATMADGDHLLLRGEANAAAQLASDQHLSFRQEDGDAEDTVFNRSSGLAEVMIPPRSAMIGQTVYPGMATESGDLIVIAVQRQGSDLGPEPALLAAGDTVLLQGTWKALDIRLTDPEVLVVNSPDVVRRQAVPLGQGAKQAIVVLFAMVLMLATGLLPPAVAGLGAAAALILTGTVTVEQSYRAIDWTTVILVGAMMPLSTAMQETGAAKLMAETLVHVVGDAGPYALLAGLFLLTALLGQLISNTATALIVIPISVAAAQSIGVNPQPVLMSVAVAAAGAFLTPIATPTNLMVMGPGGYAFSDYWKLGLPLLIWFGIISIFYVPMIWRF